MTKPVTSLSLFFCLLLCSSLFVWGAISIDDLVPPSSIPLQSQYYTVDSAIEDGAEPGFLKFHVHSPHAEYEVEGLIPLKKLLSEIEVIEKVKQQGGGTGFKEGAVDSVEETGEGFANFVSHPIRSIAGIGKAFVKLLREIGNLFRKKEEGEKSPRGEKKLGRSGREVASKLGVDVYTTNPHLRQMLSQMARARLGGKGAAMIFKWFLPVAEVASLTMTAGGINTAADQLVNDKDRGELYRLNKKSLLTLGFSPRKVKQFLSLPYYSPREATYFRFYLEALKNAEGFHELLKAAARASSRGGALKILYEVQMASSGETAGYRRVRSSEEGLAVEKEGGIVFITPYDYLSRSSLGERVIQRAAEVRQEWAGSSLKIWTGGKATTDFSSQARSEGFEVREWLFFGTP